MSNNKAIVLSGGMDSLVTAAIAAKENSEFTFCMPPMGSLRKARSCNVLSKLPLIIGLRTPK